MRWLLALGIALAIAPSASGAVPKACGLLGPAEAKDALGGPLVYRTADGNRLWQACTWHGEQVLPGRPGHRWVMMMVNRMSKSAFNRNRYQYRTSRTVRGVGDAAYAIDSQSTLAVWHDGLQLEITTANLTAPQAAAKRVAIAALARL